MVLYAITMYHNDFTSMIVSCFEIKIIEFISVL